jgi:phospholipase/lecithinase/hemolysin
LTVDYNDSLTLTYDFAYNCATVSSDLVPTCGPDVRTLVDQVGQFKDITSGAMQYGNWTSTNSLFAFWFGINDVNLPMNWDGIDHHALHDAVISRYFEEVESLYGFGARKILIMNLPSLERTPRLLEQPDTQQVLEKELCHDFNVQLHDRVGRFTQEHEDVSIVLVDTVPIFNRVLNNPEEFGARDEFCIGGYDDDCVWADDFHPGRILHEYVARNVVKSVNGMIDGFFKTNR